MKPVSAADAPAGRRGCWLARVGGRRVMVVVEGMVVATDCCNWCMYGVSATDGAVYTEAWLEVIVGVVCPSI